MASIDDILASAKPRSDTVRVSLRGDLAREYDRLETELHAATDDARLLELAEQLEAVQADIRAHAVEFVIVGLGKKRWTDLLADHPPTDEQRAELGRWLDHNPETFPYEAIAASITDPEGLTAEKVHDLEDILTVGEWERLWRAVVAANVGDRVPGESLAASAVLRRLRPSSEPPATSAPPAASSAGAA